MVVREPMKELVICLILLAALATNVSAQQTLEYDFTSSSAELLGTSSVLQYLKGTLVSIGKNGQAPLFVGTTGSVTFTTPVFRFGDTTRGGTFGTGGSFFISTPYDVDVTAVFVSGRWRFVTLQNGTHSYVLEARIKGTMFLNGITYNIHGLTIQLSANTGRDLFGGSSYMSGGITTVVTLP